MVVMKYPSSGISSDGLLLAIFNPVGPSVKYKQAFSLPASGEKCGQNSPPPSHPHPPPRRIQDIFLIQDVASH